jgi:hypothetical protein
MKTILSVVGAGLLVAASHAIAGPGHAGDITLTIAGGKMHTAIVPEGGGTPEAQRVFASEFFDVGGFVFSDEPGYEIEDGTLTPGSGLFVTMRKAVRSWNGTDFSTIALQTITASFGPNSITSNLTDIATGGLLLPVEAGGGLHDHPDVYLNDPFAGIYLLELELSSDAGLEKTDPFWIVYNYGADEADHDAAIEWVNSNLVPAPGSLALLGFGLVATRRRR